MISQEYEVEILKFFVRNSHLLRHHRHRFKLVNFSSPLTNNLMNIVLRMWDKFGDIPSEAQMRQLVYIFLLNNPVEQVLSGKYSELVERIYNEEDPATEITEDVVCSIFSRMEMSALALDMPSIIDREDGLAVLRARLDDIDKIRVSDSMGCRFFADMNKTWNAYEEALSVSRTPTFISPLDSAIRGGFFPGEMIILVGATGGGKSSILVGISANIVKPGGSVIYYTTEMEEIWIAERFFCNFTNKPASILETSFATLSDGIRKYQESKETLIIKYMPEGTTVSQLESHYQKLKEDNSIKTPSLIVVDYGDELGCGRKYGEKRHEYAEVFKELKKMASRQGIPILTATQANQGALDKENISLRNISEAFAKAWPANIVLGVAQTEQEYLAAPSKFRLILLKNRKGKKMVSIPMQIDYSTCNMWVDADRMNQRIAPVDARKETKEVRKAERIQ